MCGAFHIVTDPKLVAIWNKTIAEILSFAIPKTSVTGDYRQPTKSCPSCKCNRVEFLDYFPSGIEDGRHVIFYQHSRFCSFFIQVTASIDNGEFGATPTAHYAQAKSAARRIRALKNQVGSQNKHIGSQTKHIHSLEKSPLKIKKELALQVEARRYSAMQRDA